MSAQIFQVQCLILCGLFISLLTSTHTFNYAPKPQIVITGPQLKFFKPQTRSSYFGYTIVMRTSSVIIGAPRAQSTLELQRKVNETGAIYRCPLDKPTACYPYIFDIQGNRNIEHSDYTYDSEKRDFQWLGASMDGGLKDTDKFIVCAPRFIAPVEKNDYLMHGLCYWINDTLADQPKDVRKISPLRLKQDQIRKEDGTKFYYYMLAEQGLSVHITPDNEEFLIGAPGIHTWKGSVIRHRKRVLNDDPSLSRRDTERASRIRRQMDMDLENTQVYYESDIPNPQNFHQPSDSYFGYSVSSGYFDSNDKTKLLYLASAPQANEQSGEAYIYDYTSNRIKKNYVFRGEQFGEYFGYAVLAEDINGDGLTDVIVSAPQHRVSGLFDDGAIYVFINQGRFNFERKLITSPVHGKSRFGTTLTRLGDLNQDGYNDIAVGAPFAGDGSVFVYLGSERGLRDQHSQRLDSPKEFIQSSYGAHMFGHGLSKGSDIDGNGFNDIAIGAPNAETVLLYKAYPVVKIIATLKSDTREIKPGQSTFPLSVCYSISTKSNESRIQSQELDMHVVLDPQVKRVTISSTNRNEMKFKAVAKTQTQCSIMDCNVKFIESEIFKPIELELHYNLVNQVPDSEVFCETCAAVDPAEPKVFSEKIIFSTGCASEICIADMQVKSSGLDHSYILGSSRTLKVTYDVSNTGETAYLPQINITSSNRLPFARYPSNCKVHESVMLCDLNRGQAMVKGAKDSVTVIYDVSSLTGTAMILTAEVFSTGKELNPGNNIVKDVITLGEFTEIEAVGAPKTPHINLEKMSNTAEVKSYYEIKSNGPSNVGAMKVVFNIPVAYRIPGSLATIPIIDMDNITMQATYNSQLVVFDFFQNNITLVRNSISTMSSASSTMTKTIVESSNGLHYNAIDMGHVNEISFKNTNNDFGDSVMSASMGHSRRRREAAALTANKDQYARIAQAKSYDLLSEDLKGTLPVNRTIVFNCNDPEMTVCVQAVMEVYNFKPETPIIVTMSYNVDLKEVNQILIEPWEFFVVLVGLDVVKTNGLPSTLAVSKKIDYHIISKHQLYGTPIWVIILAILGGILVLALITYGMYRAGFFKRATKEEMDKLVHQAQISSDGVTEASNLNDENN
ncbi:integrin alpha-PS3-like isoform X1 [Lucilia sericata]|uniref:integrin alpha-PS3-like isoform X1 n=1 Tax=Lucilia sericata TaxID=13632 RepID=UPI0018A84D4B|nr:integrin alpha-PS3-like isoform X1 [Lucilia sericata]